MSIEKQLSVFLENKPGVLARLCASFKEHHINIVALSVSDTVDHAVVRMVVSDPVKALHLLEERGVLVLETNVLAIKIPDRPGAMATVAEGLSNANVNIEYAYGTAGGGEKGSVLIIRVSDLEKAQRVLGA